MSDEVWRRETVASPCVKLCVVDPASRLCIGCRRSIEEIARWSAMAEGERSAIMADLPGRPLPAPVRRGGRAGRRG